MAGGHHHGGGTAESANSGPAPFTSDGLDAVDRAKAEQRAPENKWNDPLMGKKKAPVDSDYSGRPLDRPAPKELDDVDWREDLADVEGLMSDDGAELVAGHDDRYYYLGKNGWPDYDRGAVDPVTLKPIAEQ